MTLQTTITFGAAKLASLRSVLRAYSADNLTALVTILYLMEHHKKCVPMAYLAQANQMTASGISLPVKKLESSGLLERYRSEDDRRKICVRLTALGEHLANALIEILNTN